MEDVLIAYVFIIFTIFLETEQLPYKDIEYFDGSFIDYDDNIDTTKTIFINITSFQSSYDWICLIKAGVLMLQLADEKTSTYYLNQGYENAKSNFQYFNLLKK